MAVLSRRIAWLCLWGLLAAAPAIAEPEAADLSEAQAAPAAQEVKAVEVQGNHLIATATILAKVKTRPGNPFSQEVLDEDIRRLYATGFFVDVATEIRDYQAGVLVRFLLKERPVIAGIVIAGNTALREPAIRKVLTSKENEMLDRRTLKDDLDAIERLYREKGFQLAEVTHDVKLDEATNKATVTITVIEGKKVVIKRLTFDGNRAFPDRRLRKLMATRRGGFFIPGYYREEVLEDDLEKLRDFYRKAGYSDVQVDKAVTFDDARKSLAITITIDEGRQYLVGEIAIEGNTQIPDAELRRRLTLMPGAPFSQEALRENAVNLQTAYFALGYMTNRVEPNTVLNPATGKVDITYAITEGGITYVEEVIVQGNTKTKDPVIRREIRVAPGERFDGEKLRRSKERLYNLGYFEEVTLDTAPGSDPGHRDLVVNVKEAKTGEFSFGGGFSSTDRLLGFAEVTQRNFDLLNWPTFTGGGQELRLRGTTGSRRRDLLLSFTEPWMLGTPYLFGVDAYDRVRDRGDGYSFDLGRRGTNLRTGHALSEYNRWDAVYRLERASVENVSDTASADLKAETGRRTVSSVRLQFSRDTRDNRFFPKRGYSAFLAGEVAGSLLGGSRDFVKLTWGGSRFYEPFKEQVLELTANFGLADSFGDSNSVPIFERFFAGGADTIRGYKERRVGPKDRASRDPIGGESMILGTVEYSIPIASFLRGAVFYDLGNVYERFQEFATEGLKSGTGVGVRVKTPFGPMKLDIGYPLNPDAGEKRGVRFHFSASRDF
ncbi:MAG: outer membrane protein assembly factor BamA [Candidatus Omnitrophica bacterium]|nr:outer membrane protein assembly factor BamA [Candidatus Omnitrophota bacterium]